MVTQFAHTVHNYVNAMVCTPIFTFQRNNRTHVILRGTSISIATDFKIGMIAKSEVNFVDLHVPDIPIACLRILNIFFGTRVGPT